MKCEICGKEIAPSEKFCSKCGCDLVLQKKETQKKIITKSLEKVNTCKNLWLIIGLLQIAFGAMVLCTGYIGILLIVAGAISLVHWHGISEKINEFQREPTRIVYHFEQGHVGLMLSIVFNFIFGGVIGILPPIYEMHLMSFVRKNKDKIYNI